MYKARNDFIVAERLEEEEKPATTSGIILPESRRSSDFIKLKVLSFGSKVADLKVGDIVLGEKMFIPIDESNKKIGLIRDEYVHLIEDGK